LNNTDRSADHPASTNPPPGWASTFVTSIPTGKVSTSTRSPLPLSSTVHTTAVVFEPGPAMWPASRPVSPDHAPPITVMPRSVVGSSLGSHSRPSAECHTIGRGIPSSSITDPPSSQLPEGVGTMAPNPPPFSRLSNSATSSACQSNGWTSCGSVVVVEGGVGVVVAAVTVVGVATVVVVAPVPDVVSAAEPSAPRQAARTADIRTAASTPLLEDKVSPPGQETRRKDRGLVRACSAPTSSHADLAPVDRTLRSSTLACGPVELCLNVFLWRLTRRASPNSPAWA